MSKIVVSEFVTLDGVMEAPGAEKGFDRGGWNLPYMNDEAADFKFKEMLDAEAMLLGRVTYEIFAEFWPTAKLGEFSDTLNGLKKYVVSADLPSEKLTWKGTHPIKDNVVEEIRKLREKPGKDILVYGSATLVQTLVQNDLVDEYRLMVHPIILGKGKKLFQDGLDKKELKLVSTKTFATGLVMLTYQRSVN